MNDAPAFRQVFENQCKAAMWLVLPALQVPSAKHNCRVRREHSDFNIGEAEGAHFCAVRIFLAVSIADCLPTAPDFVTGNKNGRRRFCIAVHKFVDVAAVPRVLLCVEYGLNFRD